MRRKREFDYLLTADYQLPTDFFNQRIAVLNNLSDFFVGDVIQMNACDRIKKMEVCLKAMPGDRILL